MKSRYFFSKKIYYNLKYRIERAVSEYSNSQFVNYLWFKTKDWGDTINPVVITYLSGFKPKGHDIKAYKYLTASRYQSDTFYLIAGSTLQHADQRVVVWGSGFSYSNQLFKNVPKDICAVRGPLSRKLILDQGIKCPDVYGDPLLLLSKYYKPKISQDYSIGIISHASDYHYSVIQKLALNSEVLIIDTKRLSVKEVADSICRCERILSSSLHGIILADSYQIPSGWIKNSARSSDQNFKFHDYFASLGIHSESPYIVTATSSIKEMAKTCKIRDINLDLNRLENSCPFKN